MTESLDPDQIQAYHDAHRLHHLEEAMLAEKNNAELDEFLDSLTAKQLLVLRHMLRNTADSGSGEWSAGIFEGMVNALLRVVHGVDPQTGLPLGNREVI